MVVAGLGLIGSAKEWVRPRWPKLGERVRCSARPSLGGARWWRTVEVAGRWWLQAKVEGRRVPLWVRPKRERGEESKRERERGVLE